LSLNVKHENLQPVRCTSDIHNHCIRTCRELFMSSQHVYHLAKLTVTITSICVTMETMI